jgi:hypothetical protein
VVGSVLCQMRSLDPPSCHLSTKAKPQSGLLSAPLGRKVFVMIQLPERRTSKQSTGAAAQTTYDPQHVL